MPSDDQFVAPLRQTFRFGCGLAQVADDPTYREPWQLRILVVEDQPCDFRMITRALGEMQEFDAAISRATRIDDAVAMIETNDFDVALIDYRLPDGTGDEVIVALEKKSSRCASIVVSDYSMAEISLFALRAGAMSAIAKDDVTPALLETTIRFALRNKEARRELGETQVAYDKLRRSIP